MVTWLIIREISTRSLSQISKWAEEPRSEQKVFQEKGEGGWYLMKDSAGLLILQENRQKEEKKVGNGKMEEQMKKK